MLRLCFLLALLIPLPGGAAELERECIDEPIFGGSVCVYQANPNVRYSVLLVHGIDGSARYDWEFQIPALAESYHVVAIDLPGFGASSKGRKAYTPDHYAQLLAFIAGRYIEGPHAVIGHSMGAVVALRYAARYANSDLGSLTLIDPAGILHGIALTKALAGSYASRFGDSGFAAFIARMTGKLLGGLEDSPLSPDAMLAKHPNAWMSDDPGKTAAFGVAAADMSHDIEAVDQPTLILCGQNDEVTPLRTGQVLEARMSNARLVVVPDAGHVAMRDQPLQVQALIKTHLVHGIGGKRHATGVQGAPTTGEPGRIGRCRNQRGVSFSGHYDRIEVQHCDRVLIRNARVGAIYALESRLNILDSEIVGTGTALEIVGSEVEATASRIAGETGIVSSRSRLDLAGVEIVGRKAGVISRSTTDIVFSVSNIVSPHNSGYLHGFRELNDDERL